MDAPRRSSRSAAWSRSTPASRALGGVDFDVRPGEVHCIVGPNGAGKSTLIKCIAGVVDADRRRDPASTASRSSAANPSAAIDRGVATIYQELDLVDDLTRRRQHLPRPRASRRRASSIARRMRRETDRPARGASTTRRSSPRRLVSDLRPAGQQIVSIARSLSHDVRLLIMDEPSAILDDSEIETLFDVVRRLTAEGVGVVYISHRLDEIRRIGDRVTVLQRGGDGGLGPPGRRRPPTSS